MALLLELRPSLGKKKPTIGSMVEKAGSKN